jgi:hypothetical protein
MSYIAQERVPPHDSSFLATLCQDSCLNIEFGGAFSFTISDVQINSSTASAAPDALSATPADKE